MNQKARLSVYQSIFVPTLIYAHRLWVVTERMRLRIQEAELSFLRRVAGLSLRDWMRSSVIWERLRVEPLLFHIERNHLHLVRMPLGHLPGEVFRACPTGRGPRGRPRAHWRDYISRLASPWCSLGIVGRGSLGEGGLDLCLSYFPHNLITDKWKVMNGLMDG